MRISLILIFLSLTYLGAKAQNIKNEDLIYDDKIHTVLFYRTGNQMNPPVIRLGTNDKLRLAFDDMSNKSYLFHYTIIHCDHNWNPTTNLQKNEYIDGFEEADITNYEFSLNAIPPYVHYEAIFPGPDMRIILSGNYILKVYVDNPSDENVIFTRRFFVIESLARFDVRIPYYPKKLEYTRMKQQLDVMIQTPDMFNDEPQLRTFLTIQQNGRWDNAKTGLKPTSVTSNTLNYDYQYGIVFNGGNQFRHFNIESYWYQSMYIKQIISDADGYVVILHTSYPRTGKQYETEPDINGHMLIQARKGQNTNTEGEYAWVEFRLKMPKIHGADVYILGQLNDWQLDGKSVMIYDNSLQMYRGSIYLKQGYYDYIYAVLPDGETRANVTPIEGDHWETGNDYTFYLYYRERVPEYDRLVGYMTMNSKTQN